SRGSGPSPSTNESQVTPMSLRLRGSLARLDRGRARLGLELAVGVAELGDGLDERHGPAPLAFLLVDLVDAGLHRQLGAGARRRPVEDVLLAAVEQPLEVHPDLRERRRAGA